MSNTLPNKYKLTKIIFEIVFLNLEVLYIELFLKISQNSLESKYATWLLIWFEIQTFPFSGFKNQIFSVQSLILCTQNHI